MAHASVTLTGTFTALDGSPDQGKVYIRATSDPVLDTGDLVLSGLLEVDLDLKGHFEVSLPASDDVNLTPTNFGYKMWWRLADGGNSPYLFFALPTASGPSVDVVDILPSDPSTFDPGVNYATQAELDAAILGEASARGTAVTSEAADRAAADATLSAAIAAVTAASEQGFFRPEDHGAVGDGVADDSVAVQAAIDAALAAGGGLVILSQRYACAGDIVHRGSVSVMGVTPPRYRTGVAPLSESDEAGLIAYDATFRYVYGTSGNSSRDDNPGPLMNLMIDGRGIAGAGAELFRAQSAQGVVAGVHVINSAGDGMRLTGACQNTAFRDCYIGYCPSGSAIHLLQEPTFQSAGGVTFYGCYVCDSNKLLFVDCDGTNSWPQTCTWTDCLFEQRQVAHHSIVHVIAAQIDFRGCIFTRSINSATAPTSDALMQLDTLASTVTNVALHACDFNGGSGTGRPTDLIKANFTSGFGLILTTSGYCTATNSTAIIGLVAGSPTIANRAEWGTSGTPNPTAHYRVAGGSASLAKTTRQTPDWYLGLLNSVALSARGVADANHRFTIGETGSLAWWDGAGGLLGSIAYAFGIFGPSGIWHFQDGLGAAPNEYAAATGTVTLDAAAAHLHTIECAAGATVNIAINNPSKGRMLKIGIKGNGTNTITWSATISWSRGAAAPAAPPDGTWIFIDLVYAGATAGWRETNRSS